MVTKVVRGFYGEIISGVGTVYDRAQTIVRGARKKGLLERPYDNTEWNARRGKRIGQMLNEDLYDIAPGAALVQFRYVDMHKYGTGIRKEYFLIRRDTTGKITVDDMESDKPRIMKLAKSGLPVGGVISAITGKKPAKIMVASNIKKTGYKVLSRDANGCLVSAWDLSPWELGKTRVEAATADHTGGFYCYRHLDDCLTATRNSAVFGDARSHDDLVITEVETSGKTFEHNNQFGMKLCTSRMKIVRILGNLDDFDLKQAA